MAWTKEQRREYMREYRRRRVREEPEYRERLAANQQQFNEQHPGYQREYYQQRSQDPEYLKRKAALKRENRVRNRERERETNRRWREANPGKHQAHNRKARYGITAEQYDSLLEAQGGGCALCGKPPEPGKKALHVDHDHACCPGSKACGKCIRGLLCRSCNHGLGNFNDNRELLIAAIKYLDRRPLSDSQ